MEKDKKGLDISLRSFITAIIILFVMMIGTYILTFLIEGGQYERVLEDGKEVIVAGTYRVTKGGIPFWKWLLSPFLILGAEGNITIISIIVFLMIIGGTFSALQHSGVLNYMLDKICNRFGSKKYTLLYVVTGFFMMLGAFVGSFEECIPLVPIAVALSISMGWDCLVGLGMSILAVGCGFATGVSNPFTVGVAQELAGLPMFSGISFRLLSFVVIYMILILFLSRYAKRIECVDEENSNSKIFIKDAKKEKALTYFVGILGVGVASILVSGFVPVLQGIIMPLIALAFLAAGLVSVNASGIPFSKYLIYMRDGIISILPAVLLILMASSIKYTMTEANIMDTILYQAVNVIGELPKGAAILCIYLLVLVLNFFISSGSAKAFLLIPLIMPLADMCGISRQVCILAFAFGDGFSNVAYPTNPVLLIGLGMGNVKYGTWIKWTIRLQIVILIATSGILLLANTTGY